MISENQFSSNLLELQLKIKESANKSNRSTDEINIVAVTKTFPTQAWNMSVNKKLFLIGESRVQETEKKYKIFNKLNKIELHLIGHLQKNKVKKAINYFDVIQTIDSIKLLTKINKTAKQLNKKQKIFLQVNIGRDPNKYGFNYNETIQAAEYQNKLKNIELNGIMTIPPANQPTKKLQHLYSKTRELKNKIQLQIDKNCKYLSMGMSNDFDIAITEGATHVRVGSALFGKRQNV